MLALVLAAALHLTVAVDASEGTRGILHVRETIPATPGPLTLVYPKWIPGEHGPGGSPARLASLAIRAGETVLAWRRDVVDLYAFHVQVPRGARALEVTFDILGTAVGERGGRFATPNIVIVEWVRSLLVPAVADIRDLAVSASLRLPGPAWQAATSLESAATDGATVTFRETTFDRLVDAPVHAGTNVRRWPLGRIGDAPVDLAATADDARDLAANETTLTNLRAVVAESATLFGVPHFQHYTFLLTLSDLLAFAGTEHQESSDDGASPRYLRDPGVLLPNADLLPHEFVHAWNGKYRRPADLATPNLQVPMHTDLLWIYEGLTQYYGYVLLGRSGMLTPEQLRDLLALRYAQLDTTTGRATTPLVDTAVETSLLYGASVAWSGIRRGPDYYTEAALLWLEADLTIRRLSGGARSLDDLMRAFFGGTASGPEVRPYELRDLVAALNTVQPYGWEAFFRDRVDAVAPHPPQALGAAGWALAYRPEPSEIERALLASRHAFDARYSLGLVGRDDGTIVDVVQGSPAAAAGIGPGAKIAGIDGRTFDAAGPALDDALQRAQTTRAPLRLLLFVAGTYREVTIPYLDGPRYPRTEALPAAADRFAEIIRPRR